MIIWKHWNRGCDQQSRDESEEETSKHQHTQPLMHNSGKIMNWEQSRSISLPRLLGYSEVTGHSYMYIATASANVDENHTDVKHIRALYFPHRALQGPLMRTNNPRQSAWISRICILYWWLLWFMVFTACIIDKYCVLN